MAEYIYINHSGDELRREKKGRGSAKAGAEQRDDGNWYINEGDLPAPKQPKKKKEDEPDKDEFKVVVEERESPYDDEPKQTDRRRKFEIKASDQMTVTKFFAGMAPCEFHSDGHVTVLGPGVILLQHYNFPFGADGGYNAIYGRVRVDPVNNFVEFYTFATEEFPKYVLNGLFKDSEDEEDDRWV